MRDLRATVIPISVERRISIVHSAVRTLSNYGFRGATTRRIARDAGVSEALLYKHFRSKENLLDAVLDHLVETFRPPIQLTEEGAADSADKEFLVRYAKRLLAQARSHPEEVRILFYAGLQGHRLAGEYYVRQVKSVLDQTVKRIETGQREGRYREISAVGAANCFLSMIRFQVLKLVIFGGSAPVDDEPDWPELSVEIFLKGIAR